MASICLLVILLLLLLLFFVLLVLAWGHYECLTNAFLWSRFKLAVHLCLCAPSPNQVHLKRAMNWPAREFSPELRRMFSPVPLPRPFHGKQFCYRALCAKSV